MEDASQRRKKERSRASATMKQRMEANPQQRASLGVKVIVCRASRESGAANIRATSIQKIQFRCHLLSAFSLRSNNHGSAASDAAETPKTVAVRFSKDGQ
uniref:Uncharacterized protein n=1 Tax=Opuntia streptacantha TaxID=393608 RepID=A0A7C9CS35_OPUST